MNSDTPRCDAFEKLPTLKSAYEDWRDLSRKLERDLNQCADALRRLHDAQCGAPIPAPHKYYDDWCKAMADAMVILGKLNK
jgi:hypothetical protein